MPVKYVIASTSKASVDGCRAALAGFTGVEFRVGSVPDTWPGCDAAVVWWPLAHEQYGGIPEPGVAQVLLNSLESDAPEVIMATPPGRVELRGWVRRILKLRSIRSALWMHASASICDAFLSVAIRR